MYKILLISDTHGNLDIVNELALKTKANFVIHAGDFGFYEENSTKRLSQRELCLLVTHSSIKDKYKVDKQTDRKILIEILFPAIKNLVSLSIQFMEIMKMYRC